MSIMNNIQTANIVKSYDAVQCFAKILLNTIRRRGNAKGAYWWKSSHIRKRCQSWYIVDVAESIIIS